MSQPTRKQRPAGAPGRLRPADAAGEAVAAIVARPARAALTSLGTLLGVGWFVAALGLASTAGGQVSGDFTGRLATHVRVSQASAGPVPAAYPYPADVERRLDALPGAVAAGVYWQVSLRSPLVVSAGPRPPGRPAANALVVAATPGFLAAAGVRLIRGRLFDAWDQAHAAGVCLLGPAVARTLGVRGTGATAAIYLNDAPCAVIGVVRQGTGQPAIARSVLLPLSTALALWGPPDPRAGPGPAVLIETRPGAAPQVGREAPYVISAARPDQFRAIVPSRPQRLRDQANGALSGLFTVLLWVSLAAAVLVIATVAWLAAAERVPEYALRRALGARRRHIVAHAAAESAILGLLGSAAGASLGVAVVVLVARARGWVPVVEPLTVLPAPLAGAAAGLAAGLVPALRAARGEPGVPMRRSGLR